MTCRSAIVSILIICASLFSGCGKGVPGDAKYPKKTALWEFGQKKIDETAIKKIVEEEGTSAAAVVKMTILAWQHLYDDDLANAAKEFNQVLFLDPDNAEAFYGLGFLKAITGEPDEAIPLYKKTLEINPNHQMALANLARAYKDKAYTLYKGKGIQYPDAAVKGMLAESLALYEMAANTASSGSDLRSTSRDADLSYLYYQWAVALEFNGEYDKAWEKIKLSRKHGGDSIIAYEFIKELSDFMPEPQDEELLPQNPSAKVRDRARAYYDEAVSLFGQGLYAEAIVNYTKAINIDPDYADAYFDRGIIYVTMELNDDAISDFSKVIEMDPANADAYNNRGYVYYHKEMYNEAISDIDNAISLKSDVPSFYFAKGGACYAAGRLAEARDAYAKFLAIAPGDFDDKVDYVKEKLKELEGKQI